LSNQEVASLVNKVGQDDQFDLSKGIFKFPDSKISSRFLIIELSEKLKDKPVYLGKLGLKPEPAGKVRVFAMVDS